MKMGSNVAGSNPTERLFIPPSEQKRKVSFQIPLVAQLVVQEVKGGAGDGGTGGGGGGGRGRGGWGRLEKDDASKLEMVPGPQSSSSVRYAHRCVDV